jgi:hypothetical protein
MDPYLENPEIWPEFHNRLLVAIADVLGPQRRLAAGLVGRQGIEKLESALAPFHWQNGAR